MPAIPRDDSFDSTLALLSDGYTFISKRCARFQSDIFETRLMLRRAVCTMGEDAARMFFHPGRFTRRGAIPPTTLMLLQDLGSVQTLDGAAHQRRKQMFMPLLESPAVDGLAQAMIRHWRAQLAKWERQPQVVLHSEVEEILCRAVCEWAGIPLADPEARQRAEEFSAMIDGSGAIGPRNWKGQALRMRTEQWARGLITTARSSRHAIPEGSMAHAIALHGDTDGKLLDARTAAVELINVLRPTVAVARFITFAALALHAYPDCRARLAAGEDGYAECFVQEVRRFYPFFPLIAGHVLVPFEWRAHRFSEGDWVFLDMYGTNHDARIWDEPETFRPERFRHWDQSPFNFIPQGGGDYLQGHRCPGERITIALTREAVRMLVSEMRYDVPQQDLQIDLSRMPAIPASRFVISNVRRIEPVARPAA
ncbi:cytochrome P450 [Noviherbaspirillum massiliense]|uniref:cytochrome P450 n=1 Tax=Noviherbaspirillum massiliense TaxID=1465823 RepID=UPI0003064EE8|nr:cytochrome P450 [Noviherbaspirillum massiliense]